MTVLHIIIFHLVALLAVSLALILNYNKKYQQMKIQLQKAEQYYTKNMELQGRLFCIAEHTEVFLSNLRCIRTKNWIYEKVFEKNLASIVCSVFWNRENGEVFHMIDRVKKSLYEVEENRHIIEDK